MTCLIRFNPPFNSNTPYNRSGSTRCCSKTRRPQPGIEDKNTRCERNALVSSSMMVGFAQATCQTHLFEIAVARNLIHHRLKHGNDGPWIPHLIQTSSPSFCTASTSSTSSYNRLKSTQVGIRCLKGQSTVNPIPSKA